MTRIIIFIIVIFITSKYLCIFVIDKTFVALEVKIQEIVKVLIHFGKAMPVLFFYTSTNTGAMIRELLGMQDPKGPYYDPAGKGINFKIYYNLDQMN